MSKRIPPKALYAILPAIAAAASYWQRGRIELTLAVAVLGAALMVLAWRHSRKAVVFTSFWASAAALGYAFAPNPLFGLVVGGFFGLLCAVFIAALGDD